ncbi:MAG: hypothetical protein U1F98_02165 [Verrucomicrobiota bacterium]
MRIESNFDRIPVNGVQATQARRQTATESAPVSQAQELLHKIQALPVVRLEQVARARELVNNPNYPSDEVLGRVAEKLL